LSCFFHGLFSPLCWPIVRGFGRLRQQAPSSWSLFRGLPIRFCNLKYPLYIRYLAVNHPQFGAAKLRLILFYAKRSKDNLEQNAPSEDFWRENEASKIHILSGKL
jgi:hypothetical protein